MRGRVIGAVVGLVVLVIFVLGQAGGGDDGHAEPPGGWRSADDAGLGAWAAVLAHDGVRLRVRDVDAGALRLLPGTTYLFGEGLLTARSGRRVADGIRAGARVVATGADARVLLRVLRRPPATSDGGPGDALVARRVAETTGVDRVERAGEVWSPAPRGVRPLLVLGAPDGDGDVVAGEIRAGRGRLLVVPDRGILDNGGLVRADNAAFAVAIAGRGRVVALRPRDDASVAGLPSRAALVVLLLVLAAAVALVARGRRLGPAVGAGEARTPGRSAYVDALAAVLARTADRAGAAERLRTRARAVLARRVGLAAAAEPEAVREAALLAGLDPAEAAAVAGVPDTDLQALGRALARLEGDTR